MEVDHSRQNVAMPPGIGILADLRPQENRYRLSKQYAEVNALCTDSLLDEGLLHEFLSSW
jgi:hypothetical protein